MDRRIALRSTFACVLALCLPHAGCSRPDDSIRIGFFGPLTGNTATAGIALRNGAQLAVDEVNAAGGLLGQSLRLIEYDDRSSPERAVNSAIRLVTVDRVTAIAGSLHSGNILAAASILEDFETPTLGSGVSPKWLQQGYRYLFRSSGSSALSVHELTRYAVRKGVKRVAIMHGNDEYGTTGANDFAALAVGEGIEIPVHESFTHGDRDFTGQYARITAAKPEAVLVWALGDDLGALTKQLRQAGYFGPIFGAEGYTMPQVIDVAGDATDGVVFAAQYLIPERPDAVNDPLMRRFLEAYVATYGELPASDNAYRGYDALRVIVEGIRRAGSLERSKIRDAIEAIEDLPGIAGKFSFKGNQGEGIHETRLYRIEGMKFVEVQRG